MKKLATFALLMISGSASFVQGQLKAKAAIQPDFKENLLAFNFIEDIFFNPEAGFINNTVGFSAAIADKVEVKKKLEVVEKVEVNIIEELSTVQFKYAMLLDVAVESLAEPLLYNFVDEWMGTRYRMGGTTKKGIDCSAFTGSLLLAVYGFSMPRTARDQYHATKRVEKEELEEGDLVFFNTRGGISHVGIYLANGKFAHSSSSQGVTISSLDDEYYAKRFIGGGRAE